MDPGERNSPTLEKESKKLQVKSIDDFAHAKGSLL